MPSVLELLRSQPSARRFAAAHAQSALGQGLGYVAVVTLAYDRSHAVWIVAAVLLAELLPAAVLSSLIGVLSDRLPRRALLVAADAVRCLAFALLVLVHGSGAIVALALLGGIGNAAFSPGALAGLPELVGARLLPAATGLFALVDELGYLLGPALAAALLAVTSVRVLLLATAAVFALSTVSLARVQLGARGVRGGRGGRGVRGVRGVRAGRGGAPARPRCWRREWREGVRVLRRDRLLAPLLLCSTVFVLLAGGVNLWELLLVRGPLQGGSAEYALAVTAMSAGIGVGALAVIWLAPARLHRCYALGLALCAAGLLAASAAAGLGGALCAFALFGVGDGVALTCERLLLQLRVPARLRGRAFGTRASLVAWALNGSMLLAALAGSRASPRLLLACAGAATAAVAAIAAVVLGRAFPELAPGELLPSPGAGRAEGDRGYVSILRGDRSTAAQAAGASHRYVIDSTPGVGRHSGREQNASREK